MTIYPSNINITSLLGADLWPCYGSIATHGHNAGASTWAAAKEQAKETSLVTDDNRQCIKDHFAAYGAWETEEINGWSDVELSALLIQDIAADLSGIGLCLDTFNELESLEAIQEAIELAELEYPDSRGGRVFVGNDNNLYFYVGC